VSWLSVFAAGAFVFGPAASWPAVGLLSPLFPGAQLAGVLALVRGRAPLWIAAATIGIGLARVAADGWGAGGWVGPTGIDFWIGITVEPAGTLVAAALMAQQARSEGSGRGRDLLLGLSVLLVAAAAADAGTAWVRAFAGGVPTYLAALWFGLAAFGLPLELYAAGSRSVRQEGQRRQQAEAALHHTQERFRELTESAFDLVAELDANECFTYLNPRYEEVLGYPREVLLGQRPADLVHPDDQPDARPFAEAASRSGRASGLVVRARHRDGRYLWIESAARIFLTPEGERRWVMSSRDVTDRRERELLHERTRERLEEAVSESTAALQESEARFRALADHAPELISEFDGLGRYTFANAAFRDLLGRDPQTLLGTTPEPLVHPDDLEASRAGMARALAEHGRSHAMHRLRHADGSWRWFDNTGRAYFTARGKLRFVSIGRDITEARLAEAERSRLEAHMQEVQRLESLGVLAGGIAHDFNNLLAVIMGNAALLDADAGSDDEKRARVRRIRAAANHAESLTDQMLAYAGKAVAELVPLDLSALVEDTKDLLLASISKRCDLDLELDPALPSVTGDATQLRQVLLNLVTNASEAFGSGAGRVRVRTGWALADAPTLAGAFGAAERRPGRWVFLEVSDDGPGIAEAVRGRIFEPFFSTRGVGRGLGLAAVLGIASAHHGVVKVESVPGQGSTFRLLVPPSDPPAALREATAAAPGGDARASAPRLRTQATGLVLVVDDDEAVREVAEALLADAGFRVETVASGSDALARVREGGVGAVLLDLVMPDLSGADVLRALAAEHPELPVVLASGYKRELAAERLGRETAFAFVQKPYDPEALCAALGEALEKGRGARRSPPGRA
jgi:PAS domain S-box-containing protein